MLWAYFDDSRAEDLGGECVALAGPIGSLEGWCRLLPEWQRIVTDSGMSWFHAYEWKAKEKELRDHWAELIALMNRHLIAYVGCVVPGHVAKQLEMWRREDQRGVSGNDVTAQWEREWIARERAPIGLCLAWCFALAVGVATRRPQDKVATLFAKTDKLRSAEEWIGRILVLIHDEGGRHLGPARFELDPREVVQLQVADLVAFEATAYRRVGENVRWQYQLLRSKLKVRVAETATLPDFSRL